MEAAYKQKDSQVYLKVALPDSKNPETATLDSLLPASEGRVTRIPDHPLLPILGIRVGKYLKMVARQRFGGPLIIKVNGRCVAVSRSLARRIIIEHGPAARLEVEPHG